MKKKQKHFYGEFDKDGYTIWEVIEGGREEPVYQAGNHPLDSQCYIENSKGLSLSQLRLFCFQTGMEIATENNGIFEGIQYRDI